MCVNTFQNKPRSNAEYFFKSSVYFHKQLEMNLTESDHFHKLKSTNSSNQFATFGFSVLNLFQGRVSLAASRVEQRWQCTPKNIKSTKTKNQQKQAFPSFRENYVGSDFSIAHWRYVGIKSTHFIEPKKQIKNSSFLISPNPNVQAITQALTHKLCKEVPVEYHGCRGCLTPSLCITNPRTRKLFWGILSLFIPFLFWIK